MNSLIFFNPFEFLRTFRHFQFFKLRSKFRNFGYDFVEKFHITVKQLPGD